MRHMSWNWADLQSAPVRLVEKIEEEIQAENRRAGATKSRKRR